MAPATVVVKQINIVGAIPPTLLRLLPRCSQGVDDVAQGAQALVNVLGLRHALSGGIRLPHL